MTPVGRAPPRSMFHVKRRLQRSKPDAKPHLERIRLPDAALVLRAASRAANPGLTNRSLRGVVAAAASRSQDGRRRPGREKKPGSLAWCLDTVLRWAGSLRMPAAPAGAESSRLGSDRPGPGPGPDRLGRGPDRR